MPKVKLGKNVNCETCNIEFYVSPGRLKNKHHTCSKKCQGKFSSELKSTKIKTKCQTCNVDIFYKPSHFKQIKHYTCSNLCRSKLMKTVTRGVNNSNFKNLTEIERFFWNKVKDYKHRSECKGIPFDLDYNFLLDLYNRQNGNCYYSKLPMKFKSDEGSKNRGADYNTISLDRLDSNVGYIKDNVVWSLNCINMFKGQHSIEDIKKVMKAIMLNESKDVKVRIKLLYPDSKLPTSNSPFNAGYDVYTHRFEDCGNYIKVYTGISIQPEGNFYFMLTPRSSLYKSGLTMYSNLGIIDMNYTGEIIGIFYKTSDYKGINIGDRLLQLIPQEFLKINFEEVEELSTTDRGHGGFGSSGA